jgi:hypothetical protein
MSEMIGRSIKSLVIWLGKPDEQQTLSDIAMSAHLAENLMN